MQASAPLIVVVCGAVRGTVRFKNKSCLNWITL